MKTNFMRVVSIVLAIIIFSSVLPLTASAATTGTCGNSLTWKFNRSKGTLTISGTGKMYNYEYDKVPWFEYLEDVKKIVINDGVTSIGDNAFSSCVNATSATIPDGVKTIGDWAFCYCNKITSIKIPDSVTSVGRGAFSYCWALSDVTISENLTEIVYYMFFACNSLESVTIPDSVTTIGQDAFCCCDKLKSITIPDNVTTIVDYAFAACTSLKSVILPDTVTTIGRGVFTACSSLSDVYYAGPKRQWNAIIIGEQNEELYDAKIHYNYHIHKYTTVETKATLTQNGKIVKKCKSCGEVSKTTTIYRPTSFKLSATSYTYNGKVKKPSVTVKDSKGNTLKKDTDYTVKYESGRKLPGKYTVTITFKGKYSGTKKLYFTIAPKAPSIKSLTSSTKGKAVIKWSDVSGETGYQVYYSTSKNGSYKALGSYKSNQTTATKSKLTSGKTYYFKVRAYKKTDSGTVYSSWSSVKSVKIK